MPRPTPTRAVKQRYREAVEWIALNDEPDHYVVGTDLDEVAQQLTVVLVADVFDVDQDQVALDVVAYRRAAARRQGI